LVVFAAFCEKEIRAHLCYRWWKELRRPDFRPFPVLVLSAAFCKMRRLLQSIDFTGSSLAKEIGLR